MSKRKPIEIIRNKYTPSLQIKEDYESVLAQFQEKIIAQVIDRQDKECFNFLINQIIAFMKENNVSTCFVLNKEELIDCLNEHNKLHQKIIFLQSQLDQANEKLKGLPKFKKGDIVWAIFTDDTIYKCQIDAFDYFTNTYLAFPNDDVGNEWIVASNVFKTKKEAEEKLRGGE